jgi:hypothetical protein
MMRKEIWPQTKVSTNDIETKLSEITFAACDTSVPTLITKMLDIKHQIEAEKGVTYEPNCFMTLLFDKLSGYNNKMFCYKFIAARSAYNKGKITHDKVFEALKLVYRMEQAAGTWADLMPSKIEITMLTTTLAKANVKLHKLKSSGGGRGRGGGGDRGGGCGRGGGTGRGNGNRAAKKGSGGTKDKDGKWVLTRTTDTIKHPTKGYDMKWCKFCGPGHSKGTPAGIYMHAPHGHAKWLLSKKESLEKFNAKKISPKAKKSKAGDDNDSTNNDTKHFKLSDSIINGLTTEIMIWDSEARKMAKRWFENANKGTSIQADSSVKD